MFKFLWLDTETTGLDPIENDPIQIAGIIVVGGNIEEFNFRVAPINKNAKGLEEAEKIHGVSIDQMNTFPSPKEVHCQLVELFAKYVNKFDKKDKFILAGQNVQFDCNILAEWFKKLGDKYFFSWVGYSHFDLKNLAILYELKLGKRVFPSYKLSEMAKFFKYDLNNAHDALADIRATRAMCSEIWGFITK